MKTLRRSKLLSLLLSAALCLSLLPAVSAAGSTTVVLKIGYNQMAVGTNLQPVDDQSAAVTPIAENNRTLVPVSRIVAAFGGKSTWDSKTNATTFTLNGKTVSHVIGTNTVTTPSGTKTMEVPSKALNNRTYVPVRYVLEGLGLNVGYEAKNQLVVVSTGSLSGSLLSLPESKALLEAQTLNRLPASNYTSGTQIAPARTKADMEPKYTNGAYVQDLAAATGFFFTYAGGEFLYDNFVSYDFPDDAGEQEILAELGAYVDLLAGQPGFQLIRPLGEDDVSGDYFADLTYTGSAVRMKGNLRSWYGTEETVHVEVVFNDWDVAVYLDKNLKYEDLGLRTPGGKGLSTAQVSGDRVGDAYYLDGGTYYNASDKKLSTTSGKAALLMDGKSYTAQAKFETGFKDHITLSGFDRSDTIDLSFATDYSVTGDVYGLDELRYGSREDTWGPYLCVNYDNYNSWTTPLADPDQQVYEATIRVLRWDKSGSGDTVIYFHALADIGGVMREYEGLVAVPWTDPNARPAGSGSVLDKKDCWACGGSGRCSRCGGSGRVRNSMAGTGKWIEQNCTSCGGSGRCRDCHGTGKQ